MIRPCTDADFETILAVINDGARLYKNAIPDACWKEPYMDADELRHEIASGVRFSGVEGGGGGLVGVMGLQAVKDVILIRHAYVRQDRQRRGIGSSLLAELTGHAPRPVLLGTWKAARWAVRFYEKNGFTLVEGEEKDRLLKAYWEIPARQVDASIVMADRRAVREIVRGIEAPDGPERPDGDDGLDLFRLFGRSPRG